jgi:S-adenosyl methyltransferase
MAGVRNGSQPADTFDTSVPHSARIWNYWLGGKDNFLADREAGDEFLRFYPQQLDKARACRHFLARAVRYLVLEQGIRQFLDVGTGLPTADNTHEVAQRADPEARIVYVDNDPLVLAHARALLTSSPEGATSYVDADMHDPAAILTAASETLDLDQPIALLMIGVLGHVADYGEARSIVRTLLDGLPSGSYLVETDGTDSSPEYLAAIEMYRDSGGVPYNVRTHEEIAGYYAGLDLVEPGVVPIHLWRPEPNAFRQAPDVSESGGVGRKP